MIIKLITLKVKDMEKSLEFYQKYLQFKIVDKISIPEQEMVFLSDEEGNTLELILNKKSQAMDDISNRVSFALEVDDIHETISDLKSKNVVVVSEPYKVPSGKLLAFVKDPNGIVVEFMQK